MNDLRDRRLPRIDVTGAVLKWYACAAMLFYSLSVCVVQNGMLHVGSYSNAQLQELLANDPDQMALASWAVIWQLLGGLAIPVIAFLLVEGFVHTKNLRGYLTRMAVFAAVSEIPYDFARTGQLLDWSSQNLLLTLTLCLVMLYGLKLFSAKRWAKALILLAALLWSNLLRVQFGFCMVLLAAVYYLLRDNQRLRLALGGVISLMYVTGPLSGFLLKRYNGQRGNGGNKYLFYILYPLHLLILGAVAAWIV